MPGGWPSEDSKITGSADIGAVVGDPNGSLVERLAKLYEIALQIVSTTDIPGISPDAGGSIVERLQYIIANPGVNFAGAVTSGAAYGKTFPYYEEGVDTTISVNTTLTNAGNYAQYKKLTINNNIVLSIRRTPFFLFCDEIAFGNTSSEININGPAGALVQDANMTYFASGGRSVSSDSMVAEGGAGAGMLFIYARRISGAAGLIKANGGNGFVQAANQADAASTYSPGTGALSVVSANPGLMSDRLFGVTGSGASGRSYGGGVGQTETNAAHGGSGIGPGGAVGSSAPVAPVGALIAMNPAQLLMAAALGCLGGGGGGALRRASSRGAGAAGGGGSVVVWVQDLAATPTLSAIAGTGATDTGGLISIGGPGVTHLINLA